MRLSDAVQQVTAELAKQPELARQLRVLDELRQAGVVRPPEFGGPSVCGPANKSPRIIGRDDGRALFIKTP